MNHDTIRRFAFIETRLLWAGGLSARELAEAFGIARQNAQHSIEHYRRRHPGQMRYDRHKRCHEPTESFTTNYIRDDTARFLDYQRAVSHTAYFFDEPDWADLPFTDADTLVQPIYDKQAVRIVLEALRSESAVQIQYLSKSSSRTRCISPHHLVYADGRYHLRAYCNQRLAYRDFVLARILSAKSSHEPWIPGTDDADWHQRIDLAFEINPRLPELAQSALRLEFLHQNQHSLDLQGIRKALAYYVKARMNRIDHRFGMPLWELVDEHNID